MFKVSNQNQPHIQSQALDDFPVHTMKKDLEEINDPSIIKTGELDNSSQKIYNLNDTQKSSPFLNPSTQPEKITEPKKATSEKLIISNNSYNGTADESTNMGEKVNFKKLLMIVFPVIIILLFAGGGYYFWITRQQKEPVVIIPDKLETPPETADIPTPPEAPEEPTPPETDPSENANYLTIEQANATAGEIKTTLKTYADEFLASGETTPAEYIVVDAQNNPILFSVFANSLGIKLSSSIMSNLTDIFSLFIYNDQGATRLGMAVGSKDDNLLKTAMLAEEKTIIAEISPLFMDVVFTNPANISFNKYTYNEIDLHYINLISSRPLSVDYGILNNKLLISTSKETTFSMVDYIKNSATSTAE